ncbi:MAG: CsoS2 family carboxysome shell protein, partial [Gammaproteobacteria bacterium]
ARRGALAAKGMGVIGTTGPAAAARPQRPAPAMPAPEGGGASTPSAAVAGSPARGASRARRRAMATQGKAGLVHADRTRAGASLPAASESAGSPPAPSGCGCGCKQGRVGERREPEALSRHAPAEPVVAAAPSVAPGPAATVRPLPRMGMKTAVMNPARAAALARRHATSGRGKAGLRASGASQAERARAANPNLSSRDLARVLRAQRSHNGAAGQKKSEPCGRKRANRKAEAAVGAAQDAHWKVGASETTRGQTVTGTIVGRSVRTTGDEYSTCRNVTGTEYMGADIFRQFCQTESERSPRKVGVSPTGHGNRVTGVLVGRSLSVTGDEPGTCKRVTGSQYLGMDQSEVFCGTKSDPPGPMKITSSKTRKGKVVTGNNVGRSSRVTGDEPGAARELTGTQYMQRGDGKAPAKVGVSRTLRGGAVTGSLVGRSEHVTGDEPGSCRNVTGDDYIGEEQYGEFCPATPRPEDRKVGVSRTLKGEVVTGTLTGRSGRVTGDEPGTCKAITGTPYAGAEQYRTYCAPKEEQTAAARTRQMRSTPGSVMTGLQPGIGGKLTGAHKGACDNISGTPYVGADQYAAACPAIPAEPGSPDFPQPLGETPWGQFSVAPPAHAAQREDHPGAVTGSAYEQGQITGSFSMATGKVTGTEEARFGRAHSVPEEAPATASLVEGRVKSRISGEGMDAGQKITGDDWDRGDRITGTEGFSSMRRNPTRRGGSTGAMPVVSQPKKRNDELPEPRNKVTGGSGNTDRGALVTYSGGARG